MASSIQAQSNYLAALQSLDCITTSIDIHQGGRELNPIARGLGASRSLPLCLAYAAGFNILIRNSHSQLLVKVGLITEGLAVTNNIGVMLRWKI